MKIVIITVNYNNQKETDEFIVSLLQQRAPFEVFIADASDRTPLKKRRSWENIFVKKIPNKGYAYGVNQGIKHFLQKKISHFVVVNNDVIFRDDFLKKVLASFKKFNAFTGKIYYAPGFEYHKKRYKKQDIGKVFWYAGGWIDWENIYVFHRGVDEIDEGQYDNLEETEFISGCLFCFDKRVFDKVGFWDEKYFMYWEDADYSVRIKRKGFYLIYNPEIVIWHKNAQSTEGPGSDFHIRNQRKGRLRFAVKHAGLKAKLHVIKNYVLGYE